MDLINRILEWLARGRVVVVILAGLLAIGLLWEVVGGRSTGVVPRISMRAIEGVILGKRPGPAEPSLSDRVTDTMFPPPKYRLMTIRRIPRVEKGQPMPHPYVGECKNCHLYRDGPGPGYQPKTPLGAILERLSEVQKLGPPLVPTSNLPHPPAGRCIKCHDIVVKVPEERTKGFQWGL